MVCCLTFALLCGGVVFDVNAQELRLEQLIRKHSEYCRFFQKLHIEYREVRHTFSVDKQSQQWQRKDAVTKCDWIYKPAYEMLCRADMVRSEPPSMEENVIYFKNHSDGRVLTTYRSLSCIKEFIPSSLQDSLNSNIDFTLSNKSTDLEIDSPLAAFLGMRFITPKLGYSAVPLEKYLSLFDTEAVLTSSREDNGDILWTVTYSYPTTDDISDTASTPVGEPSSCKIVFNESKGFCVHRIYSYTPAQISPAFIADTGEHVPVLSESIVMEYQKVSDKYWVPKRVADGFGTPWSYELGHKSVFYKKHYEIDNVQVNGQVKENVSLNLPEFSLVFREDLLTEKISEKNDFMPISIWGKNNEPLVTFMTRKEFNAYMKNAMAYPLPAFGISKTRIFFIVIGLIMVITALIRLYFVREKK
jgi:hypothetical protein